MMRLFTIGWVLFAVLLGTAAWALAVYGAPKLGLTTDAFLLNYGESARTPIFTGFLTMGSFLLAMKTNILTRLKESYDCESYRRQYLANNADKPKAEWTRFYAPLERLSKVLGWNVIACLATSLLQMTLGFYPHPVAFGVCVGLAGACLALLGFLTFELMGAHRDWFNTIEKKALEELEKTRPVLVEPFVYRDLCELPYEEIAQRLDIPLGTVKSRLAEARRQLQQLLAERY